MAARVYVDRFDASPGALRARVHEALGFVQAGRFLSADSRVFVKPNFTYPFYKPGVTTSPAVIEAVVEFLKEWTSRVTIVESDGGSNAWKAQEAFDGHGIPDLCRRYGVAYANLTALPRERAETEIGGRSVGIELASPMLHESDLFITLPVPKVHVMTGVSLAFKNQWGCIPDVKRLKNHPDLPYKVLAINKLLRTRIVLFDGTYFLDRTGPMDGDAIEMNLIVASDDPGTGSLACCEIMGLDPGTVSHKRLAMRIGMIPRTLEDAVLHKPLAEFQTRRFRLERTALNRISLTAFRSRFLTWLVWNSVWAKPIHELLYVFRGRPKDMTPYW